MTQVKGIRFKVGGKTFVQDSPTFEQEMFIMEQAVAAGLDDVALELTPDEKDLVPGIKRLLIQAYKRGVLFLLMASLVVEEGEEWTEEGARQAADIFRKAKEIEEREALRPLLVGALMAFFESGASLSKISSTSLDPETESADVRVATKKPARKRSLSPEEAGALFGSAHTDRVSAKLRSTNGKSQKTSSR